MCKAPSPRRLLSLLGFFRVGMTSHLQASIITTPTDLSPIDAPEMSHANIVLHKRIANK